MKTEQEIKKRLEELFALEVDINLSMAEQIEQSARINNEIRALMWVL